jgi:hypothetical protein
VLLMSKKGFFFNLGTSVVFGPAKYGYKLITEPKHRGRNAVFLAASFGGLSILSDIVEATVEHATDSAAANGIFWAPETSKTSI